MMSDSVFKRYPKFVQIQLKDKLVSISFETRYVCLDSNDMVNFPTQLEQLPNLECLVIRGPWGKTADFRLPVWVLLKLKYIESSQDICVQWDPKIYTNIVPEDRQIIFTLLCIQRFGPLRVLPIELVHLIIGHLPLCIIQRPPPATHKPILDIQSCRICLQTYICMGHQHAFPIDDEICRYVTGMCGHSFHRCCIERWCRIHDVCPLCLERWVDSSCV